MALRRKKTLSEILADTQKDNVARTTAWQDTVDNLRLLKDIPDSHKGMLISLRVINLYKIAPFNTFEEFLSEYNRQSLHNDSVVSSFRKKSNKKSNVQSQLFDTKNNSSIQRTLEQEINHLLRYIENMNLRSLIKTGKHQKIIELYNYLSDY